MPYRAFDFVHDLETIANSPSVKHAFKKFEPLTDALIAKGAKLVSIKTGGLIKGSNKKGQAKLIKAHVGEYVLPVGVKPTMTQKKAVAKRKMKAK